MKSFIYVWLGFSLCIVIFFLGDSKQEYSLGFYNGHGQNSLSQSIGVAISTEDLKWNQKYNPIIRPRELRFDSEMLNGPCPVLVGDNIYLYYGARSGDKWKIGLTVLSKELSVLSRPNYAVLIHGTENSWDEAKVFRPSVHYNPTEKNPMKKFVMIYNGANSTGVNQTGIAYSSNGIDWVKYAENPILVPGDSDEWDSQWASGEDILLVKDTYYMVYNGSDGNHMQTGIAVSSKIEGPWTKFPSNPILSAKPASQRRVLSDIHPGDRYIDVIDTRCFEVQEPCFLTSAKNTELVRIKEIINDSKIELKDPVKLAYSVKDESSLNSVLSHSIGPNQLEYENGIWKLYGSAWGGAPGHEITTYAEGVSLDNMKWNYDKIPLLDYDTLSEKWDSRSQENLKFIEIN